jgi:D-xylose transport system substrate-binding protein
MGSMGRRLAALVTAAVLGSAGLAACSGGSSAGGASAVAVGRGRIGVILPDVTSSTRWKTADPVFLSAAFRAAGVDYDIQNADGDKQRFATLADGMIASGVQVLMITNLDSDSGAEVIKKAAVAGIPVIDYDRLTLGGGAKYYVSFDNVAVGTAIGEGLAKAMRAAGKQTGNVIELDGAPTDNNATLFKQGYDKAIKDAGYTVVDSQAVPRWDNALAGPIFERMLNKAGGKVDGVVAANDGLGGAAEAVL